jgi:GDPmannose 4,6-dehydratase
VRWISQARHHLTELPTLGLIDGDLTDPPSLARALRIAEPDVVYNLAALAASGQSWAQPVTISQINGLGVLHLLEAIRAHNLAIRFVQASTSEQFGVVDEQPQNG